MLLEVNKANYAIHTFSYENDTYKSAFEASAVIKQSFEKNALLVLAASFGKDAVGIVEGLQHGLDKDTAIYGGLAGDDLTFSGTFAYSNHFYSHKGTAVLVFDAQKIKVQGLAISGWKSIGTTKKITKSIGNVVYEIDGERAYDVFTRYFGVFNPNDTRHLVSLQTNYPFQIARESDTILRSPMMLNAAEGTISLMGRVNEGDNFRFSNSPGFEVIEETVEAFQQLKDKVEEVDALVLFSCKGRQGAFGPMLEDEVSGLYNYWKKPMIGFLSYGEIGNLSTGSCEFHNETCVLVALKEQV
jgi:hypothetical protein